MQRGGSDKRRYKSRKPGVKYNIQNLSNDVALRKLGTYLKNAGLFQYFMDVYKNLFKNEDNFRFMNTVVLGEVIRYIHETGLPLRGIELNGYEQISGHINKIMGTKGILDVDFKNLDQESQLIILSRLTMSFHRYLKYIQKLQIERQSVSEIIISEEPEHYMSGFHY